MLMTPRMINNAATRSRRHRGAIDSGDGSYDYRMDFATLGRAPLRLTTGTRRITSRDLEIVEATNELLEADVPEPEGVASDVSLLRGYHATIPSAREGKERRRRARNVDLPKIGLRKMALGHRGLLVDNPAEDEDGSVEGEEGRRAASEDDVVIVERLDVPARKKGKGKRKGRESLSASKTLGRDELARQTKEIMRDKENLHVHRASSCQIYLESTMTSRTELD